MLEVHGGYIFIKPEFHRLVCVFQASDLDSIQKMGASAASTRPAAFVQPYTTSGEVMNSWKRARQYSNGPAQAAGLEPRGARGGLPTAYNYPDSEQDSSQYAMSLNGGHVIMNNIAGSRAPLGGFSSFV